MKKIILNLIIISFPILILNPYFFPNNAYLTSTFLDIPIYLLYTILITIIFLLVFAYLIFINIRDQYE